MLHVIDHLGAGGAQSLLLALTDEQRRHGVDARVLALHGPGIHTPSFHRAGVPAGRIAPSRMSPSIPAGLVRAVRRVRPRIVHAHLVVSCVLCEWLRFAFPAGTRVVSHLHNPHGKHFEDGYQDLLEHLAYRWCDAAVACGGEVARSLRRRATGCGVRVVRLPNAVPRGLLRERDPRGREAARRELGIPPRACVLLAIGRMAAPKNFPYAVEVASRLSILLPGALLLIAGEGPARGEVERRIAELGAGDCVRLLGYRTDVARLHDAADALLMTSLDEGFPMVALEAGAAGLPTIATPFASAGEFVIPGRTGILIPFGDAAVAARIVAGAFAEEGCLERLGRGARGLVAARHTLAVLVPRLRRLYDSLAVPDGDGGQ